MEYIRSAHEAEGCIFCDLPRQDDDDGALILARDETSFALLNAYPYNPGHAMVAPMRHEGDFAGLGDSELTACMRLVQRVISAIREEMSPDGFNLGMNLGRVAGAGVPGHVHWHVVPRWNGDTNFMPIVGDTRVLPELLEETRRRLAPRLSG